jgi:hypothetical protein
MWKILPYRNLKVKIDADKNTHQLLLGIFNANDEPRKGIVAERFQAANQQVR